MKSITGKLNKDHFWYIILSASFILCYFNTFKWFHYKYSTTDTYYSHGYLIPLIVGYLVYQKRDRILKKQTIDFFGYILVAMGLTIHLFATMADINFISGFSILIYTTGVLLVFLGRKNTKELSFALCYSVFMFPIPNEFINYIGLPTKLFATDVGLAIINMIDIPFYREGFIIKLRETELIVGTPCNGMKSLISFAAIGVLALNVFRVSIIKSIILLIGIYPLSIILNGIRIAILVYIADAHGIEKASPESFLHDLSGIIVFILGLIVIMILIRIWNSKKA